MMTWTADQKLPHPLTHNNDVHSMPRVAPRIHGVYINTSSVKYKQPNYAQDH